ncbi:MAG: hypothetical protein JW944_10375 [Deltaproteobacteria bacterium]|nr:hypothetical protein [Deltaproteobacteria bacterium]
MINIRRLILWSIIGIGISSISVQLVVIREFLAQFNGNEMTISVAVFSWLLLTGVGSYAAKFIKPASVTIYSLLALIAAIWPIPQMIMIRHFREGVFIHGASPGFYHIFIFILAVIAVYCLLSGFILPLSLNVLRANGYTSTSGDIYITDNIGDISGGIIFSFILVYWATPFQAIAITSSLAVLSTMALLYIKGNRRLLAGAVLLIAGFYTVALNANLETLSLSGQYGDIVKYLESPYGRVVVTREGSQHTFWESGLPLYSDENIMESEERVHYPLSQRKQIGNILIISGGLGETLSEAQKHRPGHIDYLELDPWLTGAAEEIGILIKRPNLDIINADARNYIKNSEKKYDAIIVNLPDPDTFQINRFFTNEFFRLVKDALNEDGILSFSLEYSENFVSSIRRKKLSTMYNTAGSVFKHVEIIPAARAYFICSDGEISMDIPALLRDKSVSTTYIEGFYYGNVTDDRVERIRSAIDRGVDINSDFMPGMVRIVFQEWFSQYDTSPWLFIFIIAVIFAIYLFFVKREEYILFSTGMAVMGTEMLIIFTFQVIYGYIYLRIGAVVTSFLLGLLPGAILGKGYKGRPGLMASEVIILGLLFIFLTWGTLLNVDIPQIWFFIYCFMFSFCCGFQFPFITRIMGENSRPIAGCLAADFAGAAVGTILVGAFLIPSIGIRISIIFLLLMKISSFSVSFFLWRGKRG